MEVMGSATIEDENAVFDAVDVGELEISGSAEEPCLQHGTLRVSGQTHTLELALVGTPDALHSRSRCPKPW